MHLIAINEPKTCVASSLAMVTGKSVDVILDQLFSDLSYPFQEPWSHLPKVPSMELITDWAWKNFQISFISFPRNPHCTPHESCTPVPVWYNGEEKFLEQLNYGDGLLEGFIGNLGHMCAWDGTHVYDPRGMIYPFDKSPELGFEITRFWLCI